MMDLSEVLAESDSHEIGSIAYSIDEILNESMCRNDNQENHDNNLSFESLASSRIQKEQIELDEKVIPIKIYSTQLQTKYYAINNQELINFHNKEITIYNKNKIINRFPQSNVIQIAANNDILALGFEDGQILVYQSYKFIQKLDFHTSIITALGIQLPLIIISADQQGNVALFNIKKKWFGYDIETQVIIEKADFPFISILSHDKYFTLGSATLVFTLSVTPDIKIIHVFQKQKSSIDLHNGTIVHQNENLKVISIQWNSFIQILSYLDNQEWYICYHSADESLLAARFITSDIMVTVSPQGFQLLSIPNMVPGKYSFKSNPSAILYDHQYYKQIQQIKSYKTNIFFVSEGILHNMHIMNWLEYFRQLILDKKPPVTILNFLASIYNGKIKGIPGLDLEEDQKVIKNLSQQLIKSLLTIYKDKQVLFRCITYCIQCEQCNLLDTIKDLAIVNNLIDEYYKFMEQSIQSLSSIPKSTFIDLSNNFSPESFQKLVINLSLSSIDVGFTYEECQRKKIYTPLLYICPRKEEDFITPLNRMFEINTPQLRDKCLWFIELTQKQVLFPNDSIQIDVWRKAVRQQILWLMEVLEIFQSEQLYKILYRYLSHPCFGALDHQEIMDYFSIKDIRDLPTVVYDKISKIELRKSIILHYLLFVSEIIDDIKVKEPDKLLLIIFSFNKGYIENYNLMPEDLDQILSIIHKLMPHFSLFIEAQEYKCVDYIAYSLQNQGKYAEAIDCFFQYEELQLRVYGWLELQVFNESFLDRIDKLLQLDYEKCGKLFQRWPIEVLENLIIKIPSPELLQVLKYVEMEFSHFIKIKFIDMLNTYEPQNIIRWLQAKPFPLEDLKDIFQRTGNIEGIAFIQEQNGYYQQALINYLMLYVQETLVYITKSKGADRVTEIFNHIMRNCKVAVEADDTNKSLYLQLANNLFNQDIYYSHWVKLKKTHIFNSQFSQLFMALFRYSTSELIKIIDANSLIFNLVHLKNSFISVFKEFSYERQLLKKHQSVIIYDNLLLFELLYKSMLSSEEHQIQCIECKKGFLEYKAVLMKCGHCVHVNCLQHKYCPVCQNVSVQMLLERIQEEESKQYKLKNFEQQIFDMALEQDEEDLDVNDPLIDERQIKELRTMNKLNIFDSYNDENLEKMDAFIDKYN